MCSCDKFIFSSQFRNLHLRAAEVGGFANLSYSIRRNLWLSSLRKRRGDEMLTDQPRSDVKPGERGRPWTAKEVHLLARLWGQGLTAAQIAEHLDGRNENSISIKATRIGIAKFRSSSDGRIRPDAKIRPCLTCQQPFFSEGNHNRRCDPCKSGDDGCDYDMVVHGSRG